MTYESLLKGTTWKTKADDQDAANLAESKEAMETAAASVFITIDRLGRKIHGRFGDDEQVEANQAVTDMLTQLDGMLTGNSGQIMDGFTVQAGATEAHANELESVRGQLSTAQQTNEQLRMSATEASNLRNQLTDVQSTLTAKEEELRLANLEIGRMTRDADRPNPLKSENDRLVRENSQLTTQVQTLQTDLDNEKEAHAATKHELEQLQQLQQLPDAPPVVTPPPTLVDQPEPAVASSDEPGETPPPLTHKEELKRRRGLRGALDAIRDVAPGSANPHNTPKEGEK